LEYIHLDMKKIIPIIFLTLTLNVSNGFALSGGPDAYGYTWKDSNEPVGPVYTWFDISSIGTLVPGLSDDNSSPSLINVGFNFHYYWSDYNKVKIGSNGWLSFDNPSNIASCFPNIPTAGGVNNILAVLMSDLTFVGAGNTGLCHYWSNNTDSFIVQYTNVPYWTALAPGFTGSNSFQVILSGLDSSITFQYQTTTPYTDLVGCNDVTVGIENLAGNIGLECYADLVPPGAYAIKFEYPEVVGIAVQDATPFWNQNVGSRGFFVSSGTFPISANIKNVGNATLTSNVIVNEQIRNQAFVLVHSDIDTVTPLNAGAFVTLNFNQPTIYTPGQYSFQVSTNCLSDINPTNNQMVSEIEVINACSSTSMSYHTSGIPDQQVSWNAGIGGDDGIGVFYKPPFYPVTINSLDFYIQSASGDGFEAAIYANDGAFGAPGTLISSTAVAGGSVISGAWNNIPLSSPVTIDSAGFYVVWFQSGPTIFIGLETAFPISRNTYEILDGAWSVYRENEDQDASIRVNIVPSAGIDNTTNLVSGTISANQAGAAYQWLDCGNGFATIAGATSQNYTPSANGSYAALINFGGCVDTSACVLINNVGLDETILNSAKVYPNPAQNAVNIEFLNNLNLDQVDLQITDVSGKIITIPFNFSNSMVQLNISGLSNGIYNYQLFDSGKLIAIGKFVKQ